MYRSPDELVVGPDEVDESLPLAYVGWALLASEHRMCFLCHVDVATHHIGQDRAVVPHQLFDLGR